MMGFIAPGARARVGAALFAVVALGVTAACEGKATSDRSADEPEEEPVRVRVGQLDDAGDQKTEPTDPCEPRDITDYVPEWNPPAGRYRGKCTPEQAEAAVSCALNRTPTCLAFFEQPANAACWSCTLARADDPEQSALVLEGENLVRANTPACFTVTDGDYSAESCGARFSAAKWCRSYACARCLEKHDPTEKYTKLFECEEKARLGVCAGYQSPANCVFDLMNGPSELCDSTNGESFRVMARRYVDLLCGFPPDGG